MRVMIVVTHLLGTGHLARALTLARALMTAQHTVHVISGGRPVPHLDAAGIPVTQLPPVASDGTDFSRLLTNDASVSDATYMAERQSALLDRFETERPDVLITELFPFGRRSLRHEFRDLLEAAHGRCRIYASIRDILAPPSSAKKAAFAEDMLVQFYNGVLVHADPDVITLDQSWPLTDALVAKLHYTGFVAPPSLAVSDRRDGPIVVSAGGGSVGDAVFDAAMQAASEISDLQWLFCVGGAERRQALAARAPKNVQVDGLRADFRTVLTTARASVSMCGYNTALDILQSGVPAVIVPFDDGGEVEQTLRAKALSHLPAVNVITNTDLAKDTLKQALAQVMTETRAPRTIGMDGAAETVRVLQQLVGSDRVAG